MSSEFREASFSTVRQATLEAGREGVDEGVNCNRPAETSPACQLKHVGDPPMAGLR
jgi:hypothetical protein